MSGQRNTMARDLASLIGQLPVYCGVTAAAQTIPCAWRTQRDEIRFTAAVGVLGEAPYEIIMQQSLIDAAYGRQPAPKDVLYVAGHRYRVSDVTAVDSISYILNLDRSDQ